MLDDKSRLLRDLTHASVTFSTERRKDGERRTTVDRRVILVPEKKLISYIARV